VVSLLTVAVYPAAADELLRFRSGYEMMVVSHREERGMIIATLDGGGEIGFPKEALVLLEGDKPTQRTGPTPGYNRIPPRARASLPVVNRSHDFAGDPHELQTSSTGAAIRVGYSMNGEGQVRFGPGQQGGGKVGVDIRSSFRRAVAGSPADSGPAPAAPDGKVTAHKVEQ